MVVGSVGIFRIVDSEETVECVLASIGTSGASNLGIVHTLLVLCLTSETRSIDKMLCLVVVQCGIGSDVYTPTNFADGISESQRATPLSEQRFDGGKDVLTGAVLVPSEFISLPLRSFKG